ncbi:MAG: HNH endonuclease [Chloroflexi bacterium]|nr:HNH endonuclease [Chloroflexota bacterium]
MTRFDKRPSTELRQAVIERVGGCCEYCLSQLAYSPDPFVCEHIYPRVRGGKTELSNLALACGGCNGKKYDRTQAHDRITGQMVAIFHPRQDVWAEHFAWQDNYAQVVGLTPIGRATVELLALNREGVVNLRRALHTIGKHPPDFAVS